jgi:hypothetical protein
VRCGQPATVAHSRWEANTRHVDPWDLPGAVLSWFADVLPPLGEHLSHRRAGHALASGRLGCSPKVMSGYQQGPPARWRRGAAVISPGGLDFTPEQGWPRATRAPRQLVALGPARQPSSEELAWLPGDRLITELQTPTAILGWAVPARDLATALGHLQGPHVAAASPESTGQHPIHPPGEGGG